MASQTFMPAQLKEQQAALWNGNAEPEQEFFEAFSLLEPEA